MERNETDFLAEVLEVNADTVKVKMLNKEWFEEDPIRELPLVTPYGSSGVRGFDFLPEPGNKVLVHFLGDKWNAAYIRNGLPADRLDENGVYQSDTQLDPDIKTIRLENGNAIQLQPEAICILVQEKEVAMKADAGIGIKSNLSIKLLSGKGGVTMKAKTIELHSEEEILCCGGMSSMLVGDGAHLKSSTLIQAN